MRMHYVFINPPRVKPLDLCIVSKVERKKRKTDDSDFVFKSNVFDKHFN